MSKLLSLFALLLVASLAHAQFLIVPEGAKAGSVSPKAVKAEMDAYGAYATARLELTFATDPKKYINEVDFMMTLPDHTEATGFAYWYENEYVVAKTVEKARAAQIYEFITTRQRDPALVEMVGRRQFRVRISPVDSTKDLRVEVKLVINQSRGGLALPLTSLFSKQLGSADFTLSTPEGWTENWGIPGQTQNGRTTYHFSSKPWKARSDWRASPPKSPLVTSWARPASGDGTLLVAYTAPRDMRNVQLVAPKGVLQNIYPSRVRSLRKGETANFAARIRAGAPSMATLRVGGESWSQNLGVQQFDNRSAVVLWGAQHVLTVKDRKEIRKWGMWLGIPTKETSWLAVPEAELEVLKEARMDIAWQDYAMTLAKYGPESKRAKEAYQQARSVTEANLSKDWGYTVDEYSKVAADEARYQVRWILARQYSFAKIRFGKNSKKAQEFYSGLLGASDSQAEANRVADWVLEQEENDALYNYVEGERDSSGKLKSLSQVRKWIRTLQAARVNQSQEARFRWELSDYVVDSEAHRLGFDGYEYNAQNCKRAYDLLDLYAPVKQWERNARLRITTERIWTCFWNGNKKVTSIAEEFSKIDALLAKTKVPIHDIKSDLQGYISSYHGFKGSFELPPSKLTTDAQDRFIAHYHLDTKELVERNFRWQFENAVNRVFDFDTSIQRDPKAYEQAKARLAEWAKALGRPIPPKGTHSWWKPDGRDEFVLNLRQYGPDDPRTMAARRKMEEEDAKAKKPQRVQYRAEILMKSLELDGLMWRQRTPDEEAQMKELESQVKDLRARMGDPLLVVVAPRTASVAALLPDGRLVKLTWNDQSQRWEYRFDLPPGTKEGKIRIPVWVTHVEGGQELRDVVIHVDQTAPELTVSWTKTATGWDLSVITDIGVARVNLALSDGRRLVLERGASDGKQVEWSISISGEVVGEAVVIATDGAHNRTEVRRTFSP